MCQEQQRYLGIIRIIWPISESGCEQYSHLYMTILSYLISFYHNTASKQIANRQCSNLIREAFKKNCIFYDIWQIRFLTYLPHPNWDKIIYDNLISIFDLPPLRKFGQISENIWFLRYTIYLMTSLMSCQLSKQILKCHKLERGG